MEASKQFLPAPAHQKCYVIGNRRLSGYSHHSGQGHDHLDIVDGEETRAAVQAALEPVLVHLAHQGHQVTLVEAQLPVVLGVKVVQGTAAWSAPATRWRPYRGGKWRR